MGWRLAALSVNAEHIARAVHVLQQHPRMGDALRMHQRPYAGAAASYADTHYAEIGSQLTGCDFCYQHQGVGILGAIAAARLIWALATFWRCRSSAKALAALSFAARRPSTRSCSGVLDWVPNSLKRMQVFSGRSIRPKCQISPLFFVRFLSHGINIYELR